MSKIAIVILNWNGKSFLEKFLPSVIQHNHPDADIIIADNDSNDDSVEFLKDTYPNIRVIRNKKNYGFAGGYNEALKQIHAEYYVLLNSDIEVSPNWIDPILDHMEANPDVAACQPKILSYDEPGKFEYAGASGGFIDQYGYPFCRGRIFLSLENDEGQYDDIAEVFWATGACFFVRAKAFLSLGGLDEDFFAHMEEIDFCWRLKNEGHKIMVIPTSVIYHVGGGTLPKSSAIKTYLNFRNNMILLYKNLPGKYLPRVVITRFVLDGIASLKFLLEGHIKDFFAVFRAYLSFFRTLSKTSHKRKKLKHKKPFKMYQGNIVFDHFINGKKKFSELEENNFS